MRRQIVLQLYICSAKVPLSKNVSRQGTCCSLDETVSLCPSGEADIEFEFSLEAIPPPQFFLQGEMRYHHPWEAESVRLPQIYPPFISWKYNQIHKFGPVQ